METLTADFAWGVWSRVGLLLVLGLGLALVASRLVRRLGEARLSRHQLALLRRFVFYSILVLFVVMAMREGGFQLGVLLGAAGILTVALGFASQTSASNIISGLFLLAEKPFEIGQFIEIEGVRGEVTSIDMLSVKLRTADNLYVRIPNETLIKSRLTNFTRFPVRRLDLPVGVAYREDLERVRTLLLELAHEDPQCLEEPAPVVYITAFGASSVDLQFSVWVQTGEVLDKRSSLLGEIKRRFDVAEVEIPFPHTALYAGSRSAPFRVHLERDPSGPRASGG